DAEVTLSYSLSTLTAGPAPQKVDFKEAIDLVGLQGADRTTYTFNAKNTRVTMKAAQNLSNAGRKRRVVIKGKARADKCDENLREAFTLLPHQIAGMYLFPCHYSCSIQTK